MSFGGDLRERGPGSGLVHDRLVGGERGDQRLHGEVVDQPGQPAGRGVDQRDRVVGEQGVGAAREREMVGWVKAEVATTTERLQSTEDFSAFATILLSRISGALDLLYGAFYLADENRTRFSRVGAFAMDVSNEPREFALGDALAEFHETIRIERGGRQRDFDLVKSHRVAGLAPVVRPGTQELVRHSSFNG